LIFLCALQLMTRTAGAQQQRNIQLNDIPDNVNVIGNQSLNVRNIHVAAPTGPNGTGVVRGININVPVMDNGLSSNAGGPNVQAYTSSVIPKQVVINQVTNKPKTGRPAVSQAVKPKPKSVVSASPATQRPKPKVNTAAPKRRISRPATPVTVVPALAAPVVAAQVQAPVTNPIPTVANPPLAVQQAINTDNALMQTNITVNVQASVINTASAPVVRNVAASGSSSSSGKSHRSGRKKHGSFYYQTNKKLLKLFAKTKNRKFDPAKCFVWK
jgi:hypothetical protein